jgi:hypothetical protein
LELAGWQKREEREMEAHKTRVSNTPWKLGVLETSQREFRRETKKIVKYVPVTLKLAYETHVETWLRPRLTINKQNEVLLKRGSDHSWIYRTGIWYLAS